MNSDRESAGSILAKLVRAQEANAPDEQLIELEQQLGEQIHRQLPSDQSTTVTVSVDDEIIAKPED